MNVWEPTFLVTIEGQALSWDLTQEITSLVFEDNEEESDLLELSLTNRNGQFTDDPLFQEGNTIEVKFGYVGNLSPTRKCVIKEMTYDFPAGIPTVQIKAFDKGIQMAANDVQKQWTAAPPGLTASEIAAQIAAKYGLTPVIDPSADRLLKTAQANESDAKFLLRLAKDARPVSGKECAGYSFYIENDELHFHPPDFFAAPMMAFTYFGNGEGLLQSFQPETLNQTNAAGPSAVTAKGVDPRTKAPTEQRAGNAETPDRAVMGEMRWDLATGQEQTGKIQVDPTASATRFEEPSRKPGKDQADAAFKKAELGQIKATAHFLGIPSLRAKRNITIGGVGRKFSGMYYTLSVRHQIDSSGYHCEAKLRRNAVGVTAKAATKSDGVKNDKPVADELPKLVTIDLATGTEGTQ